MPIISNLHSFSFRFIVLLAFLVLFCHASLAGSDQPHWIRITSSHFAVVTDADPKQGHEALVRFEQMRSVFAQLLSRNRVNLSEPLDILALRSDDEYNRVTPTRNNQPLADPGFFIHGADRNYAVLNLSKENSWRPAARDFASVLLNYNYPQTQAWFDEGFVDYFSSLHLDDRQAQIGEDPQQFTQLLNTKAWLSIPDLFQKRAPANPDDSQNGLFNAQSWIVMHYLLTQNKLSETGMYFGLVENEKMPVEAAIEKAYGQTADKFAQAIKDYFHSLPAASHGGNGNGIQALNPIQSEDVGSSIQELTADEGRSLVAEMSLRLPNRHDQAVQQLETITSDPKSDNVIARRALGWSHLQKKEFDIAVEELGKGADLNIKDAWLHYYLALVKHEVAQSSSQATQGLSNMMQDLHMVLDWDPDFAEARNLLAMAQLEGGGAHAAFDSMHAALQLNPRSQTYLLNLAQIYLGGKEWDAASALLDRLKTSSDAQVAKTAGELLDGLPMLKKYGVLPKSAKPQPAASAPSSTSKTAKQNPEPDEDESDYHAPVQPQPDKRPIQHLKGRLLSVDCSQRPSAILSVSAGAKMLRLRTEDYKSLMLIGADDFSCEWTSRPVAVNYKAGGKADGDLVSIELQ